MTILNDTIRRLLDQPNPAVLGTVNSDGGPQTSVVCVCRHDVGKLVSTAADQRKERNSRRDPGAGLIVHHPRDSQDYAEMRSVAALTGDIGRALAGRIAEECEGPGVGQKNLDLSPEVVRAVLRITPKKAVGSATE